MHSLFLREVSIDWDAVSDYTQHIAALHSFDRLIFQKQITFFTGENGSGKSTLLEAIAVAYGFNPEGGTKNYRFYTKDTHSSLHEGIHLSRGFCQPSCSYFLRAESFYNLAIREENCIPVPMVRAFYPLYKAFGTSACFYWMSRRPHCPHSAS